MLGGKSACDKDDSDATCHGFVGGCISDAACEHAK